MKEPHGLRRSRKALLGSSLAMIATVLPLAVPAAWAHSAVSPIGPDGPVAQYLIADRQQEIALARSAAPAAISAHASVLVLGQHGYVMAEKGTNGFVCLVVRSWDNTVTSKRAEFWNPRFRAPFCLNAAAQSVLRSYLVRTRWVLAGAPMKVIGRREDAAWAKGELAEPKPGAMCYMMSKRGRLNDGTPWRPHLMFYVPRAQASSWGANLPGVPVIAQVGVHTTLFFVLVPFWSDGTPAPGDK